MKFRTFSKAALAAVCTVMAACGSSTELAMRPATELQRDVFTCKNLSSENRWIGVTDQFDPETDPRVVVVARFAETDMDATVIYELINPLNNVALTENVGKPKFNPLGIYFEMSQFTRLGGEGKWEAIVWADGNPVGKTEFWIGEKTGDGGDESDTYFVIGEDSIQNATAAESAAPVEEPSFSDYIQEVTPALTIPDEPTADEESVNAAP